MLSFSGNLDYALERLRTASSARTSDIPPVAAPSSGRATRFAQSQVIYTQPAFYSPMHTAQNWQIPQKRRDVYQWARHFSENEPKVAAALTIYSEFPVSGFETECEYGNIKAYFDYVNKKLQLDSWIKKISREYYLIGDVFPFLEVECETCRGALMTPDGERCEHKGGNFRRMVILNPDWVDVQANQFSEEPVITLLPDDDLKKVIFNRKPIQLYERIPPHLRAMIIANRPIPLDNFLVSHLKHQPYAYGTYGTSLIRRLFKYLAYKDKLMTAQWVIAERLILPVRIVKVGDADRPAGPSDIADVQQQLAQTANDPNLTLVTHHAVDYDWIGASGKVLTLSNEFDFVNKEVLQGLMISEALLSGEQAGYQSAAIGAEVMVQRMESWRLELARWIEKKIYEPISKMRGFVDETKSKQVGEPVYIVPHIKWNDLNIRDDTQQKQLLVQLHDKQVLSTRTLCEKLELDYDQEITRRRFETAEQKIGGAQPGGAAGGAAGMGGDMGGMFGGGAGGAPPPGGEMGGAPPPGGEMGGAPAGGAPPATAASTMGGTQNKILTHGRQSKTQKPLEEEEAEPSGIPLTSLEQIMYEMLYNMKFALRMPFDPWVQYPLGPYRADFAVPQLKLAIECDGDMWHMYPDKKAKDQLRDANLAKFGWTTVRFSETDLKENKPAVQKTVSALIIKLWKKAVEQQEKKKKAPEGKVASLNAMLKTAEVRALDVDDVAFMDLLSCDFVVSFVCPPLGIFPMSASSANVVTAATESGQDGNADQGPRDQVE